MYKQLIKKIAKAAINLPVLNRFPKLWCKILDVQILGTTFYLSKHTLIGDYKNLCLANNAEINYGCFLLAKEKIVIGENSTLAYGVTILTSANPNGPHNKLSKIYPKMSAPVIIGNDVWVGANAVLLPGVKVGDFSVIAAGSIVTKDVPSGVVVAGNPAKIKKHLL